MGIFIYIYFHEQKIKDKKMAQKLVFKLEQNAILKNFSITVNNKQTAYLTKESFFDLFVQNFNEIRIQVIKKFGFGYSLLIIPSNKMIYAIIELSNIERDSNTFLEIVDNLCSILKPKELYIYGDRIPLSEVKKQRVPNTFKFVNDNLVEVNLSYDVKKIVNKYKK